MGKKAQGKQPVVLFIAGSGCQWLFSKIGDKVGGGLQNLLLAEAKGDEREIRSASPLFDPRPLCLTVQRASSSSGSGTNCAAS
jgi:hypothetical protein